jgi:DNA-binding CsgD family transcriptional regulator
MSSIALYTGDITHARALALRAIEVAEPLGDYHRVGVARSQLALVQCFAGEVEAGMRLMEPFLRLVSGASVFVPGMGRTMGALHYWRGELDEALHWLQREMPVGEAYITVVGAPGLAMTLRAAGRTSEAAEVLARTVDLARRGGMARLVADSLEQQAHLASEPDQAVDLHHEALAIRLEHGLRTFYMDSLDALALLTSRSEDAVRVLAASSQARVDLGFPRRPVDQARVGDALDGLRKTLGDPRFEALTDEGAGMPLGDVVAFVRRTRGARSRPSAGWGSLTPTELDVVRLAVEGLNNPDIGARLFMSRGTVKTHLSHVYAKLGIANRTELATLAAGRSW